MLSHKFHKLFTQVINPRSYFLHTMYIDIAFCSCVSKTQKAIHWHSLWRYHFIWKYSKKLSSLLSKVFSIISCGNNMEIWKAYRWWINNPDKGFLRCCCRITLPCLPGNFTKQPLGGIVQNNIKAKGAKKNSLCMSLFYCRML